MTGFVDVSLFSLFGVENLSIINTEVHDIYGENDGKDKIPGKEETDDLF